MKPTCDDCERGLPVDFGYHVVGDGSLMPCTARKEEATPRADKVAYKPFEPKDEREVVSADFARTLEHELAERDALLTEALDIAVMFDCGFDYNADRRKRIAEIRRIQREGK